MFLLQNIYKPGDLDGHETKDDLRMSHEHSVLYSELIIYKMVKAGKIIVSYLT